MARTERVLAEQRTILEHFLRALPREDAASLGTTRPSLGGGRAARRSPWASYEGYIDARLGLFPLHVLDQGMAALGHLPWLQRQVLRLHCIDDRTQADVALELHRSVRWVGLQKVAGLTALARALWSEDGAPRFAGHSKKPPAA